MLDSYAAVADLKTRLGITDADDDAALAAVLDAVSRMIDRYTRDYFGLETAATRYYQAYYGDRITVDSFTALTTVATDNDGDGVFENTWTTADYSLEPRNAAALLEPYTMLRRVPNGAFWLPGCTISAGLKLVGSFGWPAVPGPIREATVLESARLWTQSKMPSGVISNEQGGSNTILPDLHPTTKAILHSYVRPRLGMS